MKHLLLTMAVIGLTACAQTDSTPVFGAASSGSAAVANPRAGAASVVYVTDVQNDVLKAVDTATQKTTTIARTGGLHGVAVDAAGDVFYTVENDGGTSHVWEITVKGEHRDIGHGWGRPWGVTVDAKGNVYVSDQDQSSITKVATDGTMSSVGEGFYDANGIAVDSSGTVYVADTGHNLVKKVAPNGKISKVGAGFACPYGVTLDRSGNLYVADTCNNLIKEIVGAKHKILRIATPYVQLNGPEGIAVDGAGNIYVANSHANQVIEVTPSHVAKTVGFGFREVYGVAVKP